MKENRQQEKPQILLEILTVKEKIFLSPHYIRVVLQGDVASFAAARAGDNNKIILPKGDNTDIVLPDFGQLRSGNSQGEKPLTRTYTTRSIDLENNLLTIDFVIHGENGPGSRWAIHAGIGDQLGVGMKVKSRPLFLPADWYLLAGDHPALSVISVILEQLPADAKGKVFLEVPGVEDILELKKPEDVEVMWILNEEPGKIQTLPDAINSTSLPNGRKFIYVAAEYSSANKIRQYLSNSESLDRDEWQTHSYWKYGQSEDLLTEERRNGMHH